MLAKLLQAGKSSTLIYNKPVLWENPGVSSRVIRATLADATQISGVPINTLYTMLTGATPPGTVPDTIKRVKAWSGKRFFLVTPPKLSSPLLYTLGSTQVMHWTGDDVCSEQPSKLLVMVIPKHAAVTTTSLQPEISDAKVDDLDWASNDHRCTIRNT